MVEPLPGRVYAFCQSGGTSPERIARGAAGSTVGPPVKIAIENLTKRYGAVVAVDNLSLTIADGELLVLLGPSGCGKTTTMRAIVGLEEPTLGRISVGDSVAYDAAREIGRAHV